MKWGDSLYRYSGITVKELLYLESMKDAKVIAGEKGLNRKITKLNVMEVPDIINWVGNGEFLLTTAYSMRDNINKLDKLIVELNNKKLAGLGVKTKRYIDKIPEKTIEIAESLKFPLVEIPVEISYSTVLTEALTEIVNVQTNVLQRIDNIQNKFIKVMLDGGSLMEITEAIYENIDRNSIAIKEYIFETSAILCDEDKKKYIETIIEAESLQRKKSRESYNQGNAYTKKIDLLENEKINRVSIPIYFDNREYGCIFIWEDKRSLTPIELTVIEGSTSIIALDIYKKMSIFEIESKHKVEFFDDLFSGKENKYKRAIDRAPYFGFDGDFVYSVIIISVNGNKEFDLTNNNYIHQLKVRLLSIIQRISKNREQRIISATKSNSVVILFGSNPSESEGKIREGINEFCKEVLRYSEYEYFIDEISIGIGRNYKSARELWKSYKEAKRAVEYQKRAFDKKLIYYDDLGIYRILSFEGLQPELNQFYKEMLEPLVKYDREKGTELVSTLKKYFECEGNLKEMSDELYIHYNTAVYRLQRIKDITGNNFEDYNDRLNLQIALKILEILEKQGLK